MMKLVPKLRLMGLLLLFCLGGIVFVHAELVQTGDYILPAGLTVDGDLVVDGSLILAPGASLTVNGDLKVSNGSVFADIGASTVDIRGDLIVTNNLPGGNATIIVNGNITVVGSILTRSLYGDAYISTTGAGDDGWIEAESIRTKGQGDSFVYARDHFNVTAEIDTKSFAGEAYVRSQTDEIFAGSIVTNGYLDASVKARYLIWTAGEIITESETDDAVVEITGEDGNIYAGSITTRAELDAYVKTNGCLEVKEAIRTISRTDEAYVESTGEIARIVAGAIITDGWEASYVHSDGIIEVRGDLITRSHSGAADVEAIGGSLVSTNITTSAMGDADIFAYGYIDVRRDIWTYSEEGDAGVVAGEMEDGGGDEMGIKKLLKKRKNVSRQSRQPNGVYVADIKAYRITTNGREGASVVSYGDTEYGEGSILVRGPINTLSYNGDAGVWVGKGDIRAESIFTSAAVDGSIQTMDGEGSEDYFDLGNIIVKDIIKTRGDGDPSSVGSVDAYGDIRARSIETYGDRIAQVLSLNGSIDTVGDIRIEETDGRPLVEAGRDINARSIHMFSSLGDAQDVVAGPGSGHFQLFLQKPSRKTFIDNCEIYLDGDHEWNATLSTWGTSCTINGNGHQLKFGSNGEIRVGSGSLTLKNIVLDDVSGTKIRCSNDTNELFLDHVTWDQNGDTTFANGGIHIIGSSSIGGQNTKFIYQSTQTCTIHKNATLSLTNGVTFEYNVSAENQIYMMDSTSHLSFDDGTLFVPEDLRLTRGTLVFENNVDFVAIPGKTLSFGDGAEEDNNLVLDFHLKSQFGMYGNLVNDQVTGP